MFVEPIETLAPEVAIEVEPIGCCLQALRIEPATTKLAVAFLADEGGRFQHAQMP